jgi:hypothetical protein
MDRSRRWATTHFVVLSDHDGADAEVDGLERLAGPVRIVGVRPANAAAAVALPTSFPGDPADRLIYATAVGHGWPLITKDRRLRNHRHPRPVTVW